MFSIDDLQLKIADKLGVPANHQKFSNWQSKNYNNHVKIHLKCFLFQIELLFFI